MYQCAKSPDCLNQPENWEITTSFIFKKYISLTFEILCSFLQGMTGSVCNERFHAKHKVSLKGFSSFDKLTTQHFGSSDSNTIILALKVSLRALKNNLSCQNHKILKDLSLSFQILP